MLSSRIRICGALICLVVLSTAGAEDAYDVAENVALKAGALQALGDLDEVKQLLTPLINEYKAAAQRVPPDPNVLAGLARLQSQLNDDVTAAKTLDAAIRLEPRDARFHHLSGWLHLRANNKTAAEAEFRRAVELAPRNAKLRFTYVAVLKDLDRLSDAEAQAREWLDVDPKNPDAIAIWSMLRFKNGKADDALDALRTGVEQFPDHAPLREALGFVLHRERRNDEAYTQVHAAHQLNREKGAVLAMLIQLATELQKFTEAEAHITQLIALRRNGKYELKFFPREKFTLGDKTIKATEYFELGEEDTDRFTFHVTDKEGKELSQVAFVTAPELTEFLRKHGKLPAGQRVYLSILFQAETKTCYHQIIGPLTYSQSRAMALDIINGNCKPLVDTPAVPKE